MPFFGGRTQRHETDAGLLKGLRNLPPVIKFIISVIVDIVGCASYLIPGLAETADAWWAPVSASIIFALYGSMFYAVLGFAEEVFPGTDIFPTATVAWAYDYYKRQRVASRERNSRERNRDD